MNELKDTARHLHLELWETPPPHSVRKVSADAAGGDEKPTQDWNMSEEFIIVSLQIQHI